MNTKTFFSMFTFTVFFIQPLLAQSLSGRVVNELGAGIADASVRLAIAGNVIQSDVNGVWVFELSASLKNSFSKGQMAQVTLRGHILNISILQPRARVRVSVHQLNGKKISTVFEGDLSAGNHFLSALNELRAPQMYLLNVSVEEKSTTFKLPVFQGGQPVRQTFFSGNTATTHLAKTTAVVDTIKVSKSGYTSVTQPITSYTSGPYTITLEKSAIENPSYYLAPPDPCANQFFAEGCVWDDESSACGGQCAVANACSPPESSSKSNLAKTFICPRFLLFSREMLQAANDDAKLYEWGSGNDSPFNYAIVGHDADVGGLDDQESSCCQCYQLIFETPEPSSPQPPELPFPKSLIVQSFNTAASGPKGFDVFMGAGGYGAFNSCYDDNTFTNTTNFDEFMYDGYPYQNPGSGGITFLRYEDECRGSWPPEVSDLNSAVCQDKIEELCNQALVNASPEITEDTRQSCIRGNKSESLYHQNWQVRAKRVRCPENLTRVTGCRLKEENLPLPSPDVQTPEQADSDNQFKPGYHTTTMSDCCKPTCAWSDWVGEKGLPVDGEWNSFYSCDQNGVVLTK